ncbi:ribosomal protein S18-alanine N-acetyltransferase [Tychonema sp. LEGE 07203]|uniref:ribosomal protein S18-alanine N-acetyltransferase n=1 Tax=Tychonema sp. LEGE 07203 TaxID=1828671 RepID=UPI00187FB950|nr:ribosomal protein S18-alanine N-acetyltransferase [Tychonema sp. LEGE 07203]
MRFLEIKHLAPEHLNSAVELDRLCFGGLWSIEGYRRELDSPNSDLLGLWLRETAENGAPPEIPRTFIGIGCLWAILEEAHIIMLAIHPEFQGRGFGQALLWALLKSACDRQLERATLEVRESNLAAVSLYKKFGFKEAGRRKRYYEDTGEDAAVMWRSGLDKPEFQEYLAVEEREMRDRLHEKKWDLAIDIFEP